MFQLKTMLALGLALCLSACGNPPPDMPASKVVEQYYDALKKNDFETVLGFYAADFFNTHPKEQWREQLKQLGRLQSAEVANVQADTRYSGKFYVFQMQTQYERNTMRETLTLVWPVNQTAIRIVAHKLQP